MAEPFLAEIRMMSFNFPPKGWALANGQLLPINQNQALFALLGTTFGGNGQTNFALPNMRGRTPIHVGSGFTLGQQGGQTSHTLTLAELPTHNHVVNGTNAVGNTSIPSANALLASSTPSQQFAGPQSLSATNPSTVTATGGSQPHQNMQPFLTINFCIALQGIFPSAS